MTGDRGPRGMVRPPPGPPFSTLCSGVSGPDDMSIPILRRGDIIDSVAYTGGSGAGSLNVGVPLDPTLPLDCEDEVTTDGVLRLFAAIDLSSATVLVTLRRPR